MHNLIAVFTICNGLINPFSYSFWEIECDQNEKIQRNLVINKYVKKLTKANQQQLPFWQPSWLSFIKQNQYLYMGKSLM